MTLLEQHPERLELEQSHLFAAMEHAYRKSDMNALLGVNARATTHPERPIDAVRRKVAAKLPLIGDERTCMLHKLVAV